MNILRRLVRKVTKGIFRKLGRDHISLERIYPRDDLVRVGTDYGGWVIPASLLNADSICYCVGCGEDISFDLGIIQRYGCDVYGFDPTPRAIAHVAKTAGSNRRYHFSPVGLWDKNEMLKFYSPRNPAHVSHSALNLQHTKSHIEVPVRRLSDQMSEFGHSRIDLLKIDIEGAEYRVLRSMIEDKLDIRVLCVEFDEYFNALNWRYPFRIRRAVAGLREYGFTMVDSEGNGNYTFVRGG